MPSNEDNPSVQSIAYEAQLPDWTLVNDCFLGTRAVREKGQDYLPKNPAEHGDDYAARLNQANFWNASKRTRDGLVGMVFRKDPVLGEKKKQDQEGEMANAVPPEIQKHLENIDLQGTHFDVFAKEVFRDALSDGHSFILVDMPPPVPTDDPTVTRRDEIGRRPYWVRINKEQVINWRTETDQNGVTVLTQVTIKEVVTEPAGIFLEAEVTRYLVLRPGSWERWTVEEIKDRETKVEKIGEGTTSLDVIPLVPVYTNRTAFMVSSPPLLDLVFENLRHYRLQSDLDTIMHVCNVPILTAIGRDNPTKPMVVGPYTAVDLPVNAKMEYVEHKGSAISASQQELSNSKANMATLGLLLLSQRPQVAQTATESVIDDKAESSELAGMARGLEDGLETALMYHAKYLGKDSGGSVAINRDFAKLGLDAQKITALSNQVAANQLSLETMWEIQLRADELPSSFNATVEMERITAVKKADADAGAQVLKAFDQGAEIETVQ